MNQSACLTSYLIVGRGGCSACHSSHGVCIPNHTERRKAVPSGSHYSNAGICGVVHSALINYSSGRPNKQPIRHFRPQR